MIANLRGRLVEKSAGTSVVDVSGVGYLVQISDLTGAELPSLGEEVSLRIRTVVRQDALELYGFVTPDDATMFDLLTSVSHVGPKLALAVMSGMSTHDLVGALRSGDVARLTKVHGVGKKTAERLVLELREKAAKVHFPAGAASAPPRHSVLAADVTSALVNLGYQAARAEVVVDQVWRAKAPDNFDSALRECLRAMRQDTVRSGGEGQSALGGSGDMRAR